IETSGKIIAQRNPVRQFKISFDGSRGTYPLGEVIVWVSSTGIIDLRAAESEADSLSPWERAGVRVRRIAEGKKKKVLSARAVDPRPNLLPEGEGTKAHPSNNSGPPGESSSG